MSMRRIPRERKERVQLEGPGRKYKKVEVYESKIVLPKTECCFRQIVVSDHGREKATFMITNDREHAAAQIVRKYGRRWNIEKGISELIEFFRLNSLSSSIVVKVDFDLTMTIAAHNFYRIKAQYLKGFERETSSSLSNKFFNNGGQLTIDNDKIIIHMKKKRHLPILMEGLESFKEPKIPLLDGRRLVFKLWTTL